MATDICTRRLTKELKSLAKDPIMSPKITVCPNESNILEMHYVIEGSEGTPYAGGIYHGKLLFPKELSSTSNLQHHLQLVWCGYIIFLLVNFILIPPFLM